MNMTQENMNKRTFRKIHFVWIVFLLAAIYIFRTLGADIFSLEDHGFDARGDVNQATRRLLSVVDIAGVGNVTRLIQEGADVNAIDWHNRTLLMRAAERNTNPEVLRVLIEHGADVNAADLSGWTPLLRAAERNTNPGVLRVLIEHGADVNAADRSGWTPLMRAAERNPNPEALRILIESGADVTIKNNNGYRALDYAWRRGELRETPAYALLRRRIIENLENPTELLLALAPGANVEEITWLIQEGADVNAVGRLGNTPLMFAARHNTNPEVLRILIENGADIANPF